MAATAKPVTRTEFAGLMDRLFQDTKNSPPLSGNIAVAVSGGGDSLALTLLLSEWCAEHGHNLYALTVDHGLRPESADEARYVAGILKTRSIRHQILLWRGAKPKTGIQENAREARYDLMADFCHSRKITHLFVAHNLEDQAETILFRLAKGSGVDGLAGMRPLTVRADEVVVARPLLSVGHDRLLATCQREKLDWIEDPSNKNIRYARVRIRESFDILEKEGLSAGRLYSLGVRFDKMSKAIDQVADKEYKNIVNIIDTKRIEINYSDLLEQPEEIVLRILQQVIELQQPKKSDHVRREELERLLVRLLNSKVFKGATLGHCIFRKSKNLIIITPEL